MSVISIVCDQYCCWWHVCNSLFYVPVY